MLSDLQLHNLGIIRNNYPNRVWTGQISVSWPYKLAACSIELEREVYLIYKRADWQHLKRSTRFEIFNCKREHAEGIHLSFSHWISLSLP